jgi:hypothetical protein
VSKVTADYRTMIECAGAEYLKTDGTGIVWFRCRETGRICTVCEKKIIASER